MPKTIHTAMGKIIRFLYINQSIVIGLVVSLGSAAMIYFTKDITISGTALTPIDTARFAPQLVFGVLVFIGLLYLVQGVLQRNAKLATAPEGPELDKKATQTLRSLGALAMLFVYIFLMDKLGFVITSVLYMVACMYYMTKKSDRHPVLFVLVSVILTLVVYFCFKTYLYIYLPNGILKGVF